jgi:hypothetical protein
MTAPTALIIVASHNQMQLSQFGADRVAWNSANNLQQVATAYDSILSGKPHSDGD